MCKLNFSLLALTLAACCLNASPVRGESVTVKSGSGGDFTTVQAAIDKVLDGSDLTTNVVTILDGLTYTGGVSLLGKGEHQLRIVAASGQRPKIDGMFNCEDTNFEVTGIDFTVTDWTLLFIRSGGTQAGHGIFNDCTFTNLADTGTAEISWAETRDDATYTFNDCTIQSGRKIFEVKNGGTFTFNDCHISTRSSDGNVIVNGINAGSPMPTYNWNRCVITAPNDGLFRMEGGASPGDTDVLTYNFTNTVLRTDATIPTPIGWLQGGGNASFIHCTLITNALTVSNGASPLIFNNSAGYRPFELIFENNTIVTNGGAGYGINNFADGTFTATGGVNLYQVTNGAVAPSVAGAPFESVETVVVSSAQIDASGHIVNNSSPAINRARTLSPPVIDDIDGDVRPHPDSALPDLGADESPYATFSPTRALRWESY